MRKVLLSFVAVVIFCGLLSTATADVVFSTAYFNFSLPDTWYYTSAKWYSVIAMNLDGSNVDKRLILYDINSKGWSDDSEEQAEYLKNFAQMNGETEIIEINGQNTVLLRCEVQDQMKAAYASAMCFGDRLAAVYYICPLDDLDKEGIVNALSSISLRTASEAGSYTFGNARVFLKGYRTKTVGNTKYLLIDFEWENVGSSATMFDVNVDVTAYQDGIELKPGFILSENTESGTSIMPGKKINYTEIFQLRSSTGEIEVIVDKLIDALNEYVGRHFVFNLK